MKNWMENFESYAQQREYIANARKWWREKYPGKPIHLNEAAEQYAQSIGFDKHYLDVHNPDKIKVETTRQVFRNQIVDVLHRKIECPKCGNLMDFEALPRCRTVNPKGYSCVFSCYPDEVEYEQWEHEGELIIEAQDISKYCGHHVFVRNPLHVVYLFVKQHHSLNGLMLVEGLL